MVVGKAHTLGSSDDSSAEVQNLCGVVVMAAAITSTYE
jgi:hypothetical protein